VRGLRLPGLIARWLVGRSQDSVSAMIDVKRVVLITLAAAAILSMTCKTPTIGWTVRADVALVNGVLVDGTGASPVPDAALLIRGDRIAAVGPSDSVLLPDSTDVIDVHGGTILPGLINSHVHRAYAAHNLRSWARGGVTTVRDLGADPEDPLFAIRDSLLRDSRNARLVAAGPLVTVPNGYPMVPFGSRSGLPVTSPEDAAAKAAELLDRGADLIKVAAESGGAFGMRIPCLSSEELAAIVSVAHNRGAQVSAHVLVSQDLERALDAGVDDIAHMVCDRLSEELIGRIVSHGVYHVPTMELWRNVGYDLDQVAADNLRRLVKAGGKIALGTDYVGYTGVFDLGMPMHEIASMHDAGMTPMQIIVAATRNAAHVCGLGDELGTLEVGKIADVLVVDGNPLHDIHALSNVRLVLRDGKVVHGA
jgi:imidazolonepropionase-like amidohydrolase